MKEGVILTSLNLSLTQDENTILEKFKEKWEKENKQKISKRDVIRQIIRNQKEGEK